MRVVEGGAQRADVAVDARCCAGPGERLCPLVAVNHDRRLRERLAPRLDFRLGEFAQLDAGEGVRVDPALEPHVEVVRGPVAARVPNMLDVVLAGGLDGDRLGRAAPAEVSEPLLGGLLGGVVSLRRWQFAEVPEAAPVAVARLRVAVLGDPGARRRRTHLSVTKMAAGRDARPVRLAPDLELVARRDRADRRGHGLHEPGQCLRDRAGNDAAERLALAPPSPALGMARICLWLNRPSSSCARLTQGGRALDPQVALGVGRSGAHRTPRIESGWTSRPELRVSSPGGTAGSARPRRQNQGRQPRVIRPTSAPAR